MNNEKIEGPASVPRPVQAIVRQWIAHWRYSDGSASGVLPRILGDGEKELLLLAEECFKGFGVDVKYVEANAKIERCAHSAYAPTPCSADVCPSCGKAVDPAGYCNHCDAMGDGPYQQNKRIDET